MWPAAIPVVPVVACGSPVNPAPPAPNSLPFPSRPNAPITSSSACVVAPDAVTVGAFVAPVAIPDWSAGTGDTRRGNAFTLTALATVLGNETVMVFPAASAVVTGAEKTTVRTPEVPVPFRTSALFVYVFAGTALSVHVTSPTVGVGPASIANVTMIVFPTATPPAGTVTAIDVVPPAVMLLLVPIGLGGVGAAPTRVATSASTRATAKRVSRFASAFTVVLQRLGPLRRRRPGTARLVPQRKR